MINAEDVGVRFIFDRQRRVVTSTLGHLRRRGLETWGLRGLTFRVEPGESLAFLGSSGSGKTTLLRVIAGVLRPDAGRIEVAGRIGALLSIDSGLMPVLTGRENAILLGVLGGMTNVESRAALKDVKIRSGLGDQFERPVATYSQGMKARLGFAVAERSDPDILVLDEVHEALDHEFRAVLEERAQELLARGGIVIAAGHDHAALERLCSRAMLLHEGKLVRSGSYQEIRRAYLD